MSVTDEGYIEFINWCAKWHHTEIFALFLAPFVENGTMDFKGEQDEKWGYEFVDGKVYELKFITKRGKLITAS
jgi:hypothetical protein